jgi:hypothetical protein
MQKAPSTMEGHTMAERRRQPRPYQQALLLAECTYNSDRAT